MIDKLPKTKMLKNKKSFSYDDCIKRYQKKHLFFTGAFFFYPKLESVFQINHTGIIRVIFAEFSFPENAELTGTKFGSKAF